jgi:hypothetical protein
MLKWFRDYENLEQLKKAYKELVLKYHPDRGGDNAVMAEINGEYEKAFKLLQEKSTNKTEKNEKVNEYRDIIIQLLNISGIQIEICGAWLWISGNTYSNRKRLSEIGCHWASKKQLWYWRPAEAACYHNRNTKEMNEIRNKYGSTILKAKEQEKLEASA